MKRLVSKPSDERTTPAELFAIADRLWGPFTLDAWATRRNALCPHFYTAQTSALRHRWRGRVWANPPYSRGWLSLALGCAWAQVADGRAELVCNLVPADTSTAWWHEWVVGRADVCGKARRCEFGWRISTQHRRHVCEVVLLEGRWAFNGQSDEAKFGSAFVTYLPPRGRA